MKVKDLSKVLVTGMFAVVVRFEFGGDIINDEVSAEQFTHDYCNDEISFITIEHGKLWLV